MLHLSRLIAIPENIRLESNWLPRQDDQNAGNCNICVKLNFGHKWDKILLKMKDWGLRKLDCCEVLSGLSVSLLVLSTDDCKISVLFKPIWNLKVLSLAMARVKRVKITATYKNVISVN